MAIFAFVLAIAVFALFAIVGRDAQIRASGQKVKRPWHLTVVLASFAFLLTAGVAYVVLGYLTNVAFAR